MITKVINVNLHQPIYERLTAKQGDIASRYLLFHLLDGDKPFDLTNRTVRVYAIKPDKTEIFNDLTINDASKGYCTLELTSQCLASAGVVKMELYISQSGKVLTSIPFELEVIACINTVNSVTSTNEFSALEVALSSLQDYNNLRREIVQARKGYETVGKRLDNFDSQLETFAQQIELYKNKQTINLSKFQQELFYRNHDTSIACVGDSLTYGLDEVSSDRRASTADVTDVGVSTNPISKYTYPEILRGCLWEVYDKSFLVKKMAVGGDTLTKALDRWTTNPNVKISIMMFGTNDSYREENVNNFINNYFELIKRFLDWGSAIVLLTPPKKVDYSEIQDIHAEAVITLGKMLNIPVIDARELFDGYPLNDLTTDYVHFKPEMYYLLGSKLASLFILKRNLNEPLCLESGKHLYTDIQNNNSFILNNTNQSYNKEATFNFGVGKTINNGTSCILNKDGKIYFSFKANKDVVLIPLFKSTNGNCVIEVNFRGVQPCKRDDFFNASIPNRYKPECYKNLGTSSREELKLATENIDNNILITSRGFNTVCVNNTGTGTIEFYGFYVLDFNDYINKESILTLGKDLTYETGYSNIDGLETEIIKKDGYVDIQFAVKSSTTGFNTMFTLPVGYRPEVTNSYPLKFHSGGLYNQVYIEDWTGVVKNQSTATGDLTGYIRFKCK